MNNSLSKIALGIGAIGLAGASYYFASRAMGKNAKGESTPSVESKSSSSSEEKKAVAFHRLPTNVAPIHYDVRVQPDMRTKEEGGTFTFKGYVMIDLKVNQATRVITFNAANLKLISACVEQAGHTFEGVISVDEASETATVTLNQTIQTSSLAVLKISYVGCLNDKLKGFYRSSHRGQVMAVTQFEPTAAREALPCWDEPALKATFTARIVVSRASINKGYVAISNMPVKQENFLNELDEDVIEYVFEKTPVMSTYLLAFVVGQFDKLEAKTTEGTLVRVFAPAGKGDMGTFALDVAVKCLPFYSKYFGIKYPLPKLDLIAVPDFSSGAMENWGCTVYRETALLIDPVQSSGNAKQWVALVVAHEIAHQWFGNIVTMQWWTDLWLNEGFATWIEYLAVDEIFKDWDIWTQFVSVDLQRSMNLDALENSHPIEVEVNHPTEIDEIFDVISYSKGSCVIRKLAEYLGTEKFRQGLHSYLTKYQYSNATTGDLWRSLAEASARPVDQVMQSWTKQTGYPVLTVEENSSGFVVSQCRFLSSRKVTPNDDQTTWSIPVSVKCATDDGKGVVEEDVLMTERTQKLPLPKGSFSWVKFNVNQRGHYRVNYSPEMWKKLIRAIQNRDERLSPSDRLGIQDDAFALTRVGDLSPELLLEIVQAFRSETNYTVWSALSTNLSGIATLFKQTDFYGEFCEYSCDLFSDIANQVGWDKKPNESHLTTLLRTTVINNLAAYSHKPTVIVACERFDQYTSDGGNKDILAPDLRNATYAMLIRERGLPAFNSVLDIYSKTEIQEEKTRCLQSLGATRERELLQRALAFTFSDKVRSQDTFIGVLPVLSNPVGLDLGWQYMQENWDDIVKRFGGSFQLGRMIGGLANYTSAEKAKEIEAFFAKNKAPAAERAVLQTIEKIRSNAAWAERDLEAFRRCFQKKNA